MTSPLDGLLVADLSRVLAGPTAAVTLGDLGARVVKVERAGVGDDTRQWGPPWTSSSSSYFECANRSKESLAVDFADPSDLTLVRALVGRADVVIENFRAGSLSRFGLDYASVAAMNPRVIFCSITGFGSGAGADRPGYDFLVQAMGGLMSITGDPEGEPTKVGVALIDVLTAKDAAIGILAALRHREQTGRGQHVEVNLLSSLLASLANQASSYLTTGRPPGRMGNQHPSIAPYETLRCHDGVLAICCGNDQQFARLARIIGAPELAQDSRFRTNAERVEHRADLITALESRLATQSSAVWSARLGEAGVPAGPVGDIGAALALAEDLGLDPLTDVGSGHPPQIRHPVTYSGFAVRPPLPPPRLGFHSERLRAELAPTTQLTTTDGDTP